MSSNDGDQETIELALQLAGLSISVRGAPDRAADFVRRIASENAGQPGEHPRSDLPASSVTSFSRISEVSQASSTTSRTSIRASFEPCPEHWLRVAHSRLSGSRLSPQQRAERAWIAGQWARAVLEDRIGTPNATEAIELANRFWVVLRCSNCRCPRIFTSSGAFFAAIGRLEGSDTVTHAFPSETEARIYLESSGAEVLEFN